MSYIETRNEKIKELHKIYNRDISDLIIELSNVPELQRISVISKNKGVELSKFNVFPYKYSRLDHSFGVALILDSFKQEKKHIIEAMLHEIAMPSFEFSVEYLKSYFKMKNFLTPSIFDSIVASDVLFENFFKGDLSINDVCNYQKYSLGFAKFPRLSADNLEYILNTAYFTGICDSDEIRELYFDISIGPNEELEDEFCFSDITIANKFCKLSMEIGRKARSYESKITMQLIADVLMLMIRREEIKLEDLFKYSDKTLMEIGKNSSDKRIRDGWKQIENLNKVYIKFNPLENSDNYCVKVSGESLYIDPLVKTKAGIFRLSELDKSIEKEIETYLSSDTDLYMYIDYEL